MIHRVLGSVTAAAVLICAAPASAAAILSADFNACSNQGAGNVTKANLDTGTTGGTWTINHVEDSLINRSTTDAGDKALAGDRGPYDFDLTISGTAPALSTGLVEVSLDWQIVRTLNTANVKKNYFTGYDSSSNKVFELIFTTDGTSNNAKGRLKYVDQSGAEHTLQNGLPAVNGNPGQFVINNLTDVRLDLGATTMDIYVNDVIKANDVAYRTAGVSDLKSFSLVGSGPGNDTNTDAGAWYDNIEVVPEPATLGLLVLGGGALQARRRRRR